ncbi:MAG: molybdopterin-guanine dinucleotide biosynthesis protein B [Rhodospirillaceae bacterium TMED8]|nr:molybdopterin-guanine dinucleotide biosynthesis protein B [Magnetovibrio sp.]OUT47730.1 MAG: molybdopterin-guanine dinucleotide biosynthesis protein B [Rhodospirillaceae bacterium TMED8]|tara:strand:- start:1968 stop:2504 length:537 start_codon:yes stop_codon:yes gene_type:complete
MKANESQVFGLVGWSGSGKTTLMQELLPDLTGRGYKVSTMKHTHHNFDIDKPGKDSHVHRQAGAHEVLITGTQRWALLHENREEAEPDLNTLLGAMSPVDLVLIEGFKNHSHCKLEVFRPSIGKTLLAIEDDSIVAIASDEKVEGISKQILDLNNVVSIGDFIVDFCRLNGKGANGAA